MKVAAFLQPGWADWEAGPVLALLRRHFGADVRIATPDGEPHISIGGITARADLRFCDATDADVLLCIGSDAWERFDEPAFSRLLQAADAEDRVIGLICAGTLAGARAGLFEGRSHTSNGREWLAEHAPGYAGAERYVDTPRAVADGKLITATGLAPVTFASAVARAAAPERAEALKEHEALFSREWTG